MDFYGENKKLSREKQLTLHNDDKRDSPTYLFIDKYHGMLSYRISFCHEICMSGLFHNITAVIS